MRVWEARKDDWLYRIEEDLPDVGFYLRGYQAGADIFDYLQDTSEICMKFANQEYGLPLDAWELIQK
ncbi:MAG TPA: hypothetical protein PLP07_06895 [Pyrinomonadaceae bacterium]|nr:hypothetical protein [Chloracidobacterium sp.]MBP9936204.1 hypothetical protein [Pyrinomonadaceae bacterium]MBK7803771.1 hypothetical protein [Chloracidobacterium sp.]MBK9439557.1 hypothetical protein [Chloracidobacterium sp.]MBK9768533.1 hypothetical protein [Chloracidobacterium sp.]